MTCERCDGIPDDLLADARRHADERAAAQMPPLELSEADVERLGYSQTRDTATVMDDDGVRHRRARGEPYYTTVGYPGRDVMPHLSRRLKMPDGQVYFVRGAKGADGRTDPRTGEDIRTPIGMLRPIMVLELELLVTAPR